jgi:hypothetical protein
VSRECPDHGWECTGLGHERTIDLADLFGPSNKEKVMPIPFDPTCQTFLDEIQTLTPAVQADPRKTLQLLDVRLGLEQLLDDQDFRAELTFRWSEPDPTTVDLGPEDAFERFRAVSERHAALSVEDIKAATLTIVDTHEFHMEALARWARYDADPWPLVTQDLAGIDDAA